MHRFGGTRRHVPVLHLGWRFRGTCAIFLGERHAMCWLVASMYGYAKPNARALRFAVAAKRRCRLGEPGLFCAMHFAWVRLLEHS